MTQTQMMRPMIARTNEMRHIHSIVGVQCWVSLPENIILVKEGVVLFADDDDEVERCELESSSWEG